MATTPTTILLSFLCIIFSILIRSLVKKRANLKSEIKHPPSPPSLPLIGHLHHLSPVLHKSLHALAQRFGPLMHLRIGASTCVVASSAAMAKEIMKTHELIFSSRPKFGSSDYDLYDGYSFVTAEYGTYWRFMKKICVTKLLSTSQLDRFVDVRREETRRLLQLLVKRSEEGRPVDMGAELTTMANNMISRMVMSTRCSGSRNEAKECRNLVMESIDLAGKLSAGDVLGPLKRFDLFGHGRKLGEVSRRFDELLEDIMKKHEEKSIEEDEREGKDLMDILLEIHKDPNSETKLTRKGIKSFILELFMAGTETSSTALQWALAELINNPNVFNKLKEEIESETGRRRLVQESDVPNLPYLQAIVKETLRLHVPTPLILRKCTEDCKINGFDVLKDTRVLINAFAVMRDPSHWKEPHKFKPERFLMNSEEHIGEHQMEMKGLNPHYIPFGSGRRGCPGVSLALNVMHGTLAVLVQCFEFQVDKEGIGKTINMEEGSGFTAAMKSPLICYPIHCFDL